MYTYIRHICMTAAAIIAAGFFLSFVDIDIRLTETADEVRIPKLKPLASFDPTCAAAGYPIDFDKTIKAAVKKHWPLPWQPHHCAWRAQLARESSLSIKTCHRQNHAGAKCLAQILPTAAADIEAGAGILHSRTDARAAISGGAWYMAKLGDAWQEPRSVTCQMNLARAGYISGSGHIYKAQRIARQNGKTARCFDDGISEYLDSVISAKNALDVREYVKSINVLSGKMRGDG